jgi:hypothetical protein
VGELAPELEAEAGEIFQAADQVVKRGAKDCSAACGGQKYTRIDPTNAESAAGISRCDNDGVGPPS